MARKTMRGCKRQTQIKFSPAAKSSPSATKGTTPSKHKTSSTRNSQSNNAGPSKAPKPTMIDSSIEDDLARETHPDMSLGMPMTFKDCNMLSGSDVDSAASVTPDDREFARNTQFKGMLTSRKRRRVQGSSDSEGKLAITVTRKKRQRKETVESEAPEDRELQLPRGKRRGITKRQPTPSDDEEDEAGKIQVTPVRRRNHKPVRDFSVSEEETSHPRSNRRKVARRPRTPIDDSEEDEEQEETDDENIDDREIEQEEDQEDEDLKEDLAFLQSSPVAHRGKLRSAHEKPKSKRQKALETLKKRRASVTIEPPLSATPGRKRRIVVDSDSDSDSDSELEIITEEKADDYDEDGEEEEGDTSQSDSDADALDIFRKNEEDEAFIDNETDAIMDEPILGPMEFMPLILGRLSSSKPRELFKYAIEWMVMKKIHPGFESRSEVYAITFRKLDDEVKGLANSKFSSSAWTPDFTRALRARPDLMIVGISKSTKDTMDAHCEACNRRNHPASDELMFTGRPYDMLTLEPLDNDSDSDSNDELHSDDTSELSADAEAALNGEKPMYDAQGARLPPQSKTFTLGSTCKANAQVAHTLHHWRYHLYSWVKEYLAREGHLTAEKLVQRDGWNDKKREKAALKIVNHMEAVGEVMKLYKAYKDQMKYAAEVRLDSSRGYRGRD